MQMSVDQVAAGTGIIKRAGLWCALAFALNLAWEIAHVSLYTIWDEADRMTVAWALVHCSLGDVAIALTMFALAGLALRQVDWPAYRPWTGGVIVVIGAMAFTAWSEWRNVYQVGGWAYTADMPLIFGIGLSPMLQWLILPPLMTIAYRALSLQLLDRHNTSNPIPAHDFTEARK